MKNSLCVPDFAWQLGLISSSYKCPNGYLKYKMCLGGILKNQFSKPTADSISKIFHVSIADKNDHQILHLSILQAETVNPKI